MVEQNFRDTVDSYKFNHETSNSFISLGSEAIIHRLLNDLVLSLTTEIHNETNDFRKFGEVISYLKGVASSEPTNENTKLIMRTEVPHTISEAFTQLNLIFEYTLARGFMKVPMKPPSWEEHELLIEPSNATSADIRKIITNADHETLYKLIMDDRDEEMSPNQVHEWINLYNIFLSLYKRNVNKLRIVDRNTKKPVKDITIEQIIDNRYLKKGKCSVLYGGQGAGKSNFLAWLIGIVLLHNPKWVVLTNLPLFTETYDSIKHLTPERIKIVETLSDMMMQVAQITADGGIPVVLIDEIDQSLTSHEWNTPKAKSIYNLVLLMRHLRIRMILFYHDFNHIPQWLREGDLAGEFIRLIRMPYNNNHFTFSENTKPYSLFVPPSWIPYSTHGWSGFDIDVIVEDLSKKLKGITRKQMAEAIIELVPTLEKIADRKKGKKSKSNKPTDTQSESKETFNDIFTDYFGLPKNRSHRSRNLMSATHAYEKIGIQIKRNNLNQQMAGEWNDLLRVTLSEIASENGTNEPAPKMVEEKLIEKYNELQESISET